MDSTRKHLDDRQIHGTGLGAEFRQLKEDGTASAAELREFLSHLKGRSPEEVMGAVAQSDLIRSTLLATFGCIVLLVLLTVIPYALRDTTPTAGGKQASSKAAAAAATGNNQDAPQTADTAAATDAAAPAAEPDLQRAADAMGISDTADPDADPVDSRLEKLLDGIE